MKIALFSLKINLNINFYPPSKTSKMMLSKKSQKIIKKYIRKIRNRLRARKYYYANQEKCQAQARARRRGYKLNKPKRKPRNPILVKYITKIRRRITARKRYQKNRQQQIEKAKKYYYQDIEKSRAKNREKYQKNKEQMRAYGKKRREDPAYKEYHRAYQKKWNAENAEKRAEQNKDNYNKRKRRKRGKQVDEAPKPLVELRTKIN